MRKKAEAGQILAVIFIFLLIGSVVVGVIFLSQRGNFSKKEEVKPDNTIPFFLMARDILTKESVEANYKIEYMEEDNRVVFSEGKIGAFWNELKAPREDLLLVTVWSDKYYLSKGFITHDSVELAENKSSTIFDLEKMGDLSIIHSGKINAQTSVIKLNLTSDHNFKKANICFAWTSGFIDVSTKNSFINCDKGAWKNWTSYDDTTKTYEYLPNDTYTCGDDRLEICTFVVSTRCKISQEYRIPLRYKGKVDGCYYTGSSINNETKVLDVVIRSTEDRSYLDEIKIYLFDKDRRYNDEFELYTWFSEKDSVNLGNPLDYEYIIDCVKDCELNT